MNHDVHEFSIGSMLPNPGINDDERDLLPDDWEKEILKPIDFFKFDDGEIMNEATERIYPVYVMVMHTGTLLSNAIKTMTHSQFSHASISFDSSMKKMYSFGRKADANPFIGGFKEENINSQFFKDRDVTYALYMIPCTKHEQELMLKRLDYFTKNSTKFKYDFTGLFKNYLGISDNPQNKWFCSRFVADILNSGKPKNHKFVNDPFMVRPNDFPNYKWAKFISSGKLSDYNKSKVDKTTMDLLTHNIKESTDDILDNILVEKKIEWKNDKGKEVPKKCPKCGSDVKIFFRGEPVFLCSNKDCHKFFGVVPCTLNEFVATESFNKTSFNDLMFVIHRIPKSEHQLFYHGDTFKNSPRSAYRDAILIKNRGSNQPVETTGGAFIELYYDIKGKNVAHLVIGASPIARGKGYTDTLVKRALENAPKDIDVIIWRCKKTNIHSYNLAIRNGFKLDEKSSSGDDYVLKYYRHPEIINESIMTEETLKNWLIVSPDYIINFDQWAPGNPLWVTGASGDGKSTMVRKLADMYHAEIVTMDIVLMRLGYDRETWEKKYQDAKLGKDEQMIAHGITDIDNSIPMDYIKSHPNLPFIGKDPVTKSWDNKRVTPELIKFMYWFIDQSKNNPKYNNKLLIIEGCDICQMPPELMIEKPLIVKGGSRLRQLYWRAKRNSEEKDVSILTSIWKYIKKYNIQNRTLDDNKDNFIKGLREEEKTMDFIHKVVELNQILNDFKYGVPIRNMIPNNQDISEEIFRKYYHIASPADFMKHHGGVCWDYVVYEANMFKKVFKYPCDTWYVSFGPPDDFDTHTFLTFQYRGRYVYFESSFKKIRGIYIAPTLNDIFNFVFDNMNRNRKYPIRNIRSDWYGVWKFDANDPKIIGMGLNFMNYVTNNIEVNFTYSGKYNIARLPESIQEDVSDKLSEKLNTTWFIQDGVNNSLVVLNGKRYRERVETLIIKKVNDVSYVFLAVGKSGLMVPGGSTEPNRTNIEQAIRECQEEAYITPENLKYCLTYKMDYSPNNPATSWMTNLKIPYDGIITHLYIGTFKEHFYGRVDPKDKSKTVADGKFYEISSILNKVKPEFKQVLVKYLAEESHMSESSVELLEMVRSELADDVFGVPEQRKYSMPDAKHVISAAKLFNHVSPAYEKELARNIIKKSKKFGVSLAFVGPKNRLKKYLEHPELLKEGK